MQHINREQVTLSTIIMETRHLDSPIPLLITREIDNTGRELHWNSVYRDTCKTMGDSK